MDTGHITNAVDAGIARSRGQAVPSRCCKTTLYALVAALQKRLGPDNDALVVALVCSLFRTRRLTFCQTTRRPGSGVTRGRQPGGTPRPYSSTPDGS
jgi:hypothetical protein